jgi:hypothetical protein
MTSRWLTLLEAILIGEKLGVLVSIPFCPMNFASSDGCSLGPILVEKMNEVRSFATHLFYILL